MMGRKYAPGTVHLEVEREQRGRKGLGNRYSLQRHVLVTYFFQVALSLNVCDISLKSSTSWEPCLEHMSMWGNSLDSNCPGLRRRGRMQSAGLRPEPSEPQTSDVWSREDKREVWLLHKTRGGHGQEFGKSMRGLGGGGG